MNQYGFCDYPTPDSNGQCQGCGYTPCRSLNIPVPKAQKKIKAIWEDCPGVINDGAYLHDMRDFCSSCAPFWAKIPICSIHKKKLTQKGYCSEGKHYCEMQK